MTCRNGSHYECAKCGWSSTCEERKGSLVSKLISAVLEWEKVDDDVKENGWNSNNEFEWECQRVNMISVANDLKGMKV